MSEKKTVELGLIGMSIWMIMWIGIISGGTAAAIAFITERDSLRTELKEVRAAYAAPSPLEPVEEWTERDDHIVIHSGVTATAGHLVIYNEADSDGHSDIALVIPGVGDNEFRVFSDTDTIKPVPFRNVPEEPEIDEEEAREQSMARYNSPEQKADWVWLSSGFDNLGGGEWTFYNSPARSIEADAEVQLSPEVDLRHWWNEMPRDVFATLWTRLSPHLPEKWPGRMVLGAISSAVGGLLLGAFTFWRRRTWAGVKWTAGLPRRGIAGAWAMVAGLFSGENEIDRRRRHQRLTSRTKNEHDGHVRDHEYQRMFKEREARVARREEEKEKWSGTTPILTGAAMSWAMEQQEKWEAEAKDGTTTTLPVDLSAMVIDEQTRARFSRTNIPEGFSDAPGVFLNGRQLKVGMKIEVKNEPGKVFEVTTLHWAGTRRVRVLEMSNIKGEYRAGREIEYDELVKELEPVMSYEDRTGQAPLPPETPVQMAERFRREFGLGDDEAIRPVTEKMAVDQVPAKSIFFYDDAIHRLVGQRGESVIVRKGFDEHLGQPIFLMAGSVAHLIVGCRENNGKLETVERRWAAANELEAREKEDQRTDPREDPASHREAHLQFERAIAASKAQYDREIAWHRAHPITRSAL